MSQKIIKKYNIGAKKSLGQNFLIDKKILQEISMQIPIEGKSIIEVGPGYGALTEYLLQAKPESLDLVELDGDMVEILEDRFFGKRPVSKETGLKILHQDVLEHTPEFEIYSVIANIPYYITSPILRHFLYDIESIPEKMLILMQKDVGDKILGKGKNKSSVLSLIVEKKCYVTESLFVPKESFSPIPKVESLVVKFEIHDAYEEIDDDEFLRIIKIGFGSPRKKLINNLVSGGFEKKKVEGFLCQYGHKENTRGEDLNIADWVELVKYLKKQ